MLGPEQDINYAEADSGEVNYYKSYAASSLAEWIIASQSRETRSQLGYNKPDRHYSEMHANFFLIKGQQYFGQYKEDIDDDNRRIIEILNEAIPLVFQRVEIDVENLDKQVYLEIPEQLQKWAGDGRITEEEWNQRLVLCFEEKPSFSEPDLENN